MSRHSKQVLAGALFCASFIVLAAFAPTGVVAYDLSWNTVDGGGGTSSGGTYEVSGTTGQPDPAILTGGGYELTGGFWSAFGTLPCPTDTDGDGTVNVVDLLNLLGAWGPCAPPCPEDNDGDGEVSVVDLLNLLGTWGDCP